MIIAFSSILSKDDNKAVSDYLLSQGIDHRSVFLFGQSVFVCPTDPDNFHLDAIRRINPKFNVHYVQKHFALASRQWREKPTEVDVNGLKIGDSEINIIAGPCAVESEEQLYSIVEFLHSRGIRFLRGGAYKPRTSPYAFQGLRTEGLKLLRKIANNFEMRVVTEIMDLSLLEEVYDYTDVLQVGTRNMQNYQLLKELGKTNKPVLLKRGFSSKVEEWLMAAEYMLLGGNEKIILCERGIRTFETGTRNTLDLASIPLVKELSHLPVIADPSQGTGLRNLVTPMSMAAVAAGADGLMIEVHHTPEDALSDGQQSLNFKQFDQLLNSLQSLFNPGAKTFDFAKNHVILPR